MKEKKKMHIFDKQKESYTLNERILSYDCFVMSENNFLFFLYFPVKRIRIKDPRKFQIIKPPPPQPLETSLYAELIVSNRSA